MILAIDIGNTNISFGIFRGNKIIKRLDIPTRNYNLRKLSACLGKISLDNSIICSVVPKAMAKVKHDLAKITGIEPYYIGKGLKVPLRNLYRYPGQVGQDRLVNAYAATLLYGAPAVVVDFGTAVTLDVISKNKEYLGGMILLGLQVSLDCLAQRTALLPEIKLNKPKEFIGRDTKNSMLSGIVYGFAALTDDLTQRIKNKIGRNALVIGTGGNISLIAKYCKNINKIDKDLTLKGLNFLLKKGEENG